MSQNGITGTFNTVNATLTLTGSASVANYQAALRSVTFYSTGPQAMRTAAFIVTDGTLSSAAASRSIAVTLPNPPSIITTASALTYSQSAPAHAIDPGLAILQGDLSTLSGATVQISANYVSGQDILAFRNQRGIVGSFDAVTGTMTLSGIASVASYQAALESITFFTTAGAFNSRAITFIANDGTQTSAPATRAISVLVSTFVVTNTNDSGAGSLRQAILNANAFPGPQTVTFDPTVFSTPQTITLSSELTVTDPVTIDGPGANLLTISGNKHNRVFHFQGTPVPSGELIINGSFETPVVPISTPFPAGDPSITGWTIGAQSVDVQSQVFYQRSPLSPSNVAFDGLQVIDLEGTPGPGSLSQTFATVPGACTRRATVDRAAG